MIVLLYVGDLFITGGNKFNIKNISIELAKEFEMTIFGEEK
jgi:hypothetical protein